MWHLGIFEYTGDPRDAAPLLDDHLEWIRRHQLEGKIPFAGPSEDGELGIIVFGHMTRNAADELTVPTPSAKAVNAPFTRKVH